MLEVYSREIWLSIFLEERFLDFLHKHLKNIFNFRSLEDWFSTALLSFATFPVRLYFLMMDRAVETFTPHSTATRAQFSSSKKALMMISLMLSGVTLYGFLGGRDGCCFVINFRVILHL